MEWPGRPLRVTIFALCAVGSVSLLVKGMAGGVFLTLGVILVVPEIMAFGPWLWQLGKRYLYQTDENERFYLYGLTKIRARTEGEKVWFLARNIGDALETSDLNRQLSKLPGAHKEKFGGDLFISEDGIVPLCDALRNENSRKFKLYFEREIMSPILKRREAGA
jgi:hypothetical protein